MNALTHALQDELDGFFAALGGLRAGKACQVTKAALSRARKNLLPSAFVELLQGTNRLFYAQPEAVRRWRGLRLLAVDGSKLALPNTPALADHFGVPRGARQPMALLSGLYDVLNHRWLDASLHPYAHSERDAVAGHLEQTQAEDLLLYDRGYPAFWLYALHQAQGRAFCMRLPWNFYDATCRLYGDDRREESLIEVKPNRAARTQCAALGLSTQPIRLRLIRVPLGESAGSAEKSELLVTNLLDNERYPAADFAELYHQRWHIEEGFKALKQRSQLENWSGKSRITIEQDLYAKLLTANLNSLHILAAEQRRQERQQRRKARRPRKPVAINRAAALTRIKDRLLCFLFDPGRREHLETLIDRIAELVERVRPDRHFPRSPRKGAPRYRPSYKPGR